MANGREAQFKFTLFASLYFAQGLPYGFFTQALPVFLREANASLAAIGGASLLTLPWALKFLWAPLADRYGWPKLGLRRSWILPLQALSILSLAALSFLNPAENLIFVLIAFLICNFLAASQDVATDGLAVDFLKAEERGWANGIQVGAYRVGMIVGGSAMLFVLSQMGWQGAMLTMAGLLLLSSFPIAVFNEPLHVVRNVDHASARRTPVLSELPRFLKQPSILAWLGVLLVFKASHQAASAMMRPWLVDQGYSLAEIGTLMGFVGSGAGLAGAAIGGWVAWRWDRTRSLGWLAVLQACATCTYLLAIFTDHAIWKVALASAIDNGMSGIATVTLFAAMMDRCRPQHAAGDYTLQASIIVISQTSASALAGLFADSAGYRVHFLTVTLIGFAAAAYTFWATKRVRKIALASAFLAALLLTTTRQANAYEVGVGFGPLLPSRIAGVREVMNGWSLRGTAPTSFGTYELEWFNANGDGGSYSSFLMDLRIDFGRDNPNELLPVHFLLGFHGDQIQPNPDTGYPSRFGGGWHYGGGVSIPLSHALSLRGDFRHRFSPGNSLIVLVGLNYNFGGQDGNGTQSE